MAKEIGTSNRLNRLQKFTLWFFHRPHKTALLWLLILLFGVASYSTLLKREGFPSINTPFALATGSYLVNDSAQVDREVSKPVSDFLLKQESVKDVLAQSYANFYTLQVSYNEGIDAESESYKLSQEIKQQRLIPEKATLKFEPFKFGFTTRGDKMVVSVFSKNNQAGTEALYKKAADAARFIHDQNLPLVSSVSAISPFEEATNPLTGEVINSQKSFDRYGKREAAENKFYSSIVVGIGAPDGTDNLELHKQVQGAVNKLNQSPQFKGYQADISASFAPQIRMQIDELQKSLLEGLLAVLVIGSLVIAVRASLITVLSMITVIAGVNGLLSLIGYSLNTITLFALILSLALIVDDTIIMVEAIDAQRRRLKKPDDVIKQASGKVGRAMIAATSTAILSFAPLLFVGGVLGSFIRAIPITIISALLISLLVALVFIPMLARYIMLGNGKIGPGAGRETAAGIEAAIARFLSGPMLWAKGSTKKLILVGLTAVIVGLGFIFGGGAIFQKVAFNIFPADKDTDQLTATLTFAPDTSLPQAEKIADQVDKVIGENLDVNFVRASYYNQADVQQAMLFIDLINYNERKVTAPQLTDRINKALTNQTGAKVEVAPSGVGPPAAAFNVEIKSEQNRTAAMKLGNDIADYLKNDAVLKRVDGTVAKIKDVSVGNSGIYYRNSGVAVVTVKATFVDDDTSTLVTLAEAAVKDAFPPEKVSGYGLPKDAVGFNTGQEEENQQSFKTLAIAFPLLLFVIYVVLSFQFRSLLQPLLIFMAIPFSLFGIALGLYLTDNAFSFFTMLGFFALIGLSLKNTILLTDYANQAKRAGVGTVDSAHEALAERFRPLIATSLTAVFSLIPLTLSSPFWQGLGVVLICGLVSSTFLVITVFPYYYLGAEFLRQGSRRLWRRVRRA